MSMVAFPLHNSFVLTLNICLDVSFYILGTYTCWVWWERGKELLEPDTFLWFQSRHFENNPDPDAENFITNMAPTVSLKQTLCVSTDI